MNTGSMNGMLVRFRQAADQECCPECGSEMMEVDRCNENGTLFVWCECIKGDCDGQWLRKTLQGVE